jgi:hypothetical protein
VTAGRKRVNRDFVATAIALIVAGCGGGDDAATTTERERPLTKREFLAEADRICGFTDARIEAAADDLVIGGRDPRPAQVRRVVAAVVVPGLETEVRAIRAIGAPPGDAARIDRILAATERGIAAIEADPVSVLEGPPPALREAGRLARRYGSAECGARSSGTG